MYTAPIPTTTTTTAVPTTTTAVPTTTTTTLPPPCFVAGTRILTPKGYKPIETLQTGDHITTADNRTVPIKLYSYTLNKTTTESAPYRIAAGSLGRKYPSRDIRVSPRHAIKDANGVWQIPKFLASHNPRVCQYDVGKAVTYYHIECPNFYRDNLMAEEAEVESFKHTQGGVGVVYVWNDAISGWKRVLPHEPIPSNKKHVVYTF